MKIAFFSTHKFEKLNFIELGKKFNHDIEFFETPLSVETALLAQGFEGVCCFVNDTLDKNVLEVLKSLGVKIVALRSAGFNHVDVESASKLGLKVVRVPEYSPVLPDT